MINETLILINFIFLLTDTAEISHGFHMKIVCRKPTMFIKISLLMCAITFSCYARDDDRENNNFQYAIKENQKTDDFDFVDLNTPIDNQRPTNPPTLNEAIQPLFKLTYNKYLQIIGAEKKERAFSSGEAERRKTEQAKKNQRLLQMLPTNQNKLGLPGNEKHTYRLTQSESNRNENAKSIFDTSALYPEIKSNGQQETIKNIITEPQMDINNLDLKKNEISRLSQELDLAYQNKLPENKLYFMETNLAFLYIETIANQKAINNETNDANNLIYDLEKLWICSSKMEEIKNKLKNHKEELQKYLDFIRIKKTNEFNRSKNYYLAIEYTDLYWNIRIYIVNICLKYIIIFMV
jgi:hypothetical protein